VRVITSGGSEALYGSELIADSGELLLEATAVGGERVTAMGEETELLAWAAAVVGPAMKDEVGDTADGVCEGEETGAVAGATGGGIAENEAEGRIGAIAGEAGGPAAARSAGEAGEGGAAAGIVLRMKKSQRGHRNTVRRTCES
jgi:hypothetical protein